MPQCNVFNFVEVNISVCVRVCVSAVPTDRGGDGAATQRVERPIRGAQTDR